MQGQAKRVIKQAKKYNLAPPSTTTTTTTTTT